MQQRGGAEGLCWAPLAGKSVSLRNVGDNRAQGHSYKNRHRLLITYNYSWGSLFANDFNLYQGDIKVAVQHSKRLPNVVSGTVITDSHPGGSQKDYNRTRQTSRCSNH